MAALDSVALRCDYSVAAPDAADHSIDCGVLLEHAAQPEYRTRVLLGALACDNSARNRCGTLADADSNA